MNEQAIPSIMDNRLSSGIVNNNPSGLMGSRPELTGLQKFGRLASGALGTIGGALGGPVGWIGLGVKALGDNIKAAQSQFDLTGFKDQMNASSSNFLQAAGSSNTTSDLLGLNGMVPDYSDYINNQGYKWDGNPLNFIGSIIGNKKTEDQKQLARNYQQDSLNELSNALLGAQNRVFTNTYRQGMANYLNNAAMGGPLSTHGSDFTDDLIRIDAGGSHEQNPFGGVPAGIDPNGIPNLVEEGETIWDNGDEEYVFSKRLKAPKGIVKKFSLGGGKKGLTYSEAARRISEKSGATLRPNDPISKRTKDAMLSELEEAQEEKRMNMRRKEMLRALSEMSPEEFQATMMSSPMSQQEVEQPQMPPQGVEEEPVMQEPVQGSGMYEPVGAQGFALGGNIFDGLHKSSVISNVNNPELIARGIKEGTIKYDRALNKYVGMLPGITGTGIKQYSPDYLQKIGALSMAYDDREPLGENLISPQEPGYPAYLHNRFYFNNKDTNSGAVINDKYHIPAPTLGGTRASDADSLAGIRTVITDEHGPFFKPVEEQVEKPTGSSSRKAPVSGGTAGKSATKTETPEWTPNKIFSISGVNPIDTWRKGSLMYNVPQQRTPVQAAVEGPTESETAVSVGGQQNGPFSTWMRYAPIVGGGLSVLSDLFSRPDYSNYERLIADAERTTSPVNIPVVTIGDRIRRNPFDERLAVNQANQNLAAGLRSTTNNAGGNRAYRQFANNLMAYNSQGQLSDIYRNSYLATLQNALQTADFNRGTGIQNMNAINQRNLTQAQLNANKGYQGYYARANALNALENARRYDDQLASADLTAFLTSLGNLGRENFDFNRLNALAREGRYNIRYNGRTGDMIFNPTETYQVAKGGKVKTKKRRF